MRAQTLYISGKGAFIIFWTFSEIDSQKSPLLKTPTPP